MTPCPVSWETMMMVPWMMTMCAMSLLLSSVRPVMEQVSILEAGFTRQFLILTVFAGTRVKFDDNQ